MTVRKASSEKAATETLLLTSPREVTLMQGPTLTLTDTEPDPPARERDDHSKSSETASTSTRTVARSLRIRI